MKKFVFRLQVVLDRACDDEEAQLLHLARIRHELALKEQEITAKQAQMQELMAQMQRIQQAVFDPWEMQQCHLCLELFAEQLADLHAQRTAIMARIEAQQQIVIEAKRKKQALETLQEKQYLSYNQAVAREELQLMEEAVLPRLAREQAIERARRQTLTNK